MYEAPGPFSLNHYTLSQPYSFPVSYICPQNPPDLVPESPKVWFSGSGTHLIDCDHPKPARSGGKHEVARLVIRRQGASDDASILPGTSHARSWEHIDRKVLQLDHGVPFDLFLSEVRASRILVCRRFGSRQENADGVERYMVRGCQERRLCPFCRKAYQRGKAIDLTNQINNLCRGTGLQIVPKPVFTFPEVIRDQVKTQDQLRAFERALVEMIQAFYGCPRRPDRTYPDGTIGIYAIQHWYSTTEPWRSKPHFHILIIPVRIKGKSVSLVNKFINPSNLRELKRLWSEVMITVATSLGFTGVENVTDVPVVEWKYIRVLHTDLQPTGKSLNLNYDLRCHVDDLKGCVIGVYPGDGSRLMQYEQKGILYHVKISQDDYINEKLRLMATMRCNTRYGWLRRFKTVAPLLGVEEVIDPDPFIPVPEMTINVVYLREHTWKWNAERHKPIEEKRMYVKPLLADGPKADWLEIDPWSIHCEECFFASKRRYRVRAAADLPSRDRGG